MARAGFHPNRSVIEIADILRLHGQDYARVHAAHLGRVERRVMSAITACQTAILGGHVEACDDCGVDPAQTTRGVRFRTSRPKA
jgi:Transposase zinc-binding domain